MTPIPSNRTRSIARDTNPIGYCDAYNVKNQGAAYNVGVTSCLMKCS